jgi:uncharacterized protein (DUF2147 family)
MRGALLVVFSFFMSASQAQGTIVGKWKTIDDETQEPRSVVEIFERDGKVYGKIVKLFRKPGEDPDPVCDECDSDDPRYKKKIIGMEILREIVKSGDQYSDGNILDPNNGKVYTCKIWLEGTDLKLRGYWGPFFRTQTWLRMP